MQDRLCAEAFDRTYSDLYDAPDKPFGGITVVSGGDFRQCLPAVPQGSKEDIIAHCLQRSPLWPQIHILKLTVNMHVQGDLNAAKFAPWLLQIGEGCMQAEDSDTVEFPNHMHVQSWDQLLDARYPNLDLPGHVTAEYLQERMVLAAWNADFLELNKALRHGY